MSFDKRECEEFISKLLYQPDQTWGFYVYGTYTPNADGDSDRSKAPEAAGDDARFQAVLNKLHAYATDIVRYSTPALYNQQLIDTLRFEAAAYLPDATLADICKHFRQHYSAISDSNLEDINGHDKFGPKWNWCIVIDKKALHSIESAPEFTTSPPEGVDAEYLAFDAAFDIQLKLLSQDYTERKEPEVLSAQARGGVGRRREWNGWLTFLLSYLLRVFNQASESDDIKIFIRGPDSFVEF